MSAAGDLADLDRAGAAGCATGKRLRAEAGDDLELCELSDDLLRMAAMGARVALAGREAASTTNRFAGLRGGHEVSILIRLIGVVG